MRSRLGVHHRHDEQARMDCREPGDVDLPEDANRADLPVLAGERVVAQQDRPERELRGTHPPSIGGGTRSAAPVEVEVGVQ